MHRMIEIYIELERERESERERKRGRHSLCFRDEHNMCVETKRMKEHLGRRDMREEDKRFLFEVCTCAKV